MHVAARVLALVLAAAAISSGQMIQDARHSFRPPFYVGTLTPVYYWKIGGGTLVTEDYVRLTPGVANRRGSIWNQHAVASTNWEVELAFRIHGSSTGGDGLAFWYTQEFAQSGKLYGNKDAFRGIGVVIDTTDNDGARDNPMIMLLEGDGSNQSHNMATDWRATRRGSCHLDVRNINANSVLKVVYDNKVLQVLVDVYGKGAYQTCFMVDNLSLPTGYYFGVTASTSTATDAHDVYSLTTRHGRIAPSAEAPSTPGDTPLSPNAADAAIERAKAAAEAAAGWKTGGQAATRKQATVAGDDAGYESDSEGDIHEHYMDDNWQENDGNDSTPPPSIDTPPPVRGSAAAKAAAQRAASASKAAENASSTEIAQILNMLTHLVQQVNDESAQRKSQMAPVMMKLNALSQLVDGMEDDAEESHQQMIAVTNLQNTVGQLKSEVLRINVALKSMQDAIDRALGSKMDEDSVVTRQLQPLITKVGEELDKMQASVDTTMRNMRGQLTRITNDVRDVKNDEPLGWGTYAFLILGSMGYVFAGIGYRMFRRSQHVKLL